MLMVLLNWLYVTITVFCLGIGVAAFVKKYLCYGIKSADSLLMAGLIFACITAGIYYCRSGTK